MLDAGDHSMQTTLASRSVLSGGLQFGRDVAMLCSFILCIRTVQRTPHRCMAGAPFCLATSGVQPSGCVWEPSKTGTPSPLIEPRYIRRVCKYTFGSGQAMLPVSLCMAVKVVACLAALFWGR